MADTGVARIFIHGRSQAVRLPKAFRLPGDRVRVTRTPTGVLLEPIASDTDQWFAEIDRSRGDAEFLPEGRPLQPSMPADEDPWE